MFRAIATGWLFIDLTLKSKLISHNFHVQPETGTALLCSAKEVAQHWTATRTLMIRANFMLSWYEDVFSSRTTLDETTSKPVRVVFLYESFQPADFAHLDRDRTSLTGLLNSVCHF